MGPEPGDYFGPGRCQRVIYSSSLERRMRVVITGGAGFIGSNLVHYWWKQHPDDDIVVIDALTYAGRRESLADLSGNSRFHFHHARIEDAAAISPLLVGADLLINLAAESHNDRAIGDPLPFVRTNVLGTAVLLEASRRLDIPRFHHVSTDEVYGSLDLETTARFTEESPYRPRGPYSASKASSDHLVHAWHETYGLRTTLSNCGNNYGPFQFPEKLIPLAVTRLIQGQKVPLYGDGRHVRDWIYVEDHCRAIERIVQRGISGSTYLVSAENEVSNREVVSMLLRLFGKGEENVEYVADRPGHDRRYGLDPRKLKMELAWSAQFDFETAMASTVRWYVQNQAWWSPLLKIPAPSRGAVGGR